MTEFTISASFPATPQQVYDAWLDGEKHTEMTGGEATGRAQIGTSFTAWDGYISGTNLELEAGKRIVQSWRTTEFDEEDDPSRVEITLQATEDGCELTLRHTEIPKGQPDYNVGWHEHYFAPMADYFC